MYILLYYCHLQSYQKLTDSNLNLINSLGSKDEIIHFFSCLEDCTSDTWIVQQCKNDECVVKHYQNNQQLIEAGFPHVVSTQNLDWQWVTKQAKSSSKYLEQTIFIKIVNQRWNDLASGKRLMIKINVQD